MRASALFRAALLSAVLAAFAPASAQVKPSTRDVTVTPIEVTATPIAGFEIGNPSRTLFGRLVWRGGLVLKSASDSFGGWSGLVLDPDGHGFAAVSDAGVWMTGRIVYDQERPTGIANARLGPILASNGQPVRRNRDRDAEAMTLIEGSASRGSVLIAFEQNHRIGRFDIDRNGLSKPRHYLELPPEMKKKRRGDGIEAVAVMSGGRWKGSPVAFAEHMPDGNGHHRGWIWVKGKPESFRLVDIGGFSITDAASLPDGSLLILERRFRWLEGVKMRLRLVDKDELRPGAVITGETLLDVAMGHQIDNMEAIAVHRDRHGEIVLTIMSDDNFNAFIQRTILLQFALRSVEAARAR